MEPLQLRWMFDVTEDFLINGTVRYEDYSDFGGTVWN
jgi:iron complex outermembrane receptor protein